MWSRILYLNNNGFEIRGSQEPESLIWSNFCLLRAIILTRNLQTILTPFDSLDIFVSLIIRIISAIESYLLNLTDLEMYAKICCLTPLFFFKKRQPCFIFSDQKSVISLRIPYKT